HREEALLHADLADAATGTAGDRRGALLGTGAVTGLAAHQGRHADGHGGAAHRFLEIQLQGVAQVVATLRAAARAAATTAEEVAENVAEDVREVGTAGEAAGATAHRRIHASVAVLVVGRPLGCVGEHLVGLVDLLEFLLGGLVVRVAVRVVLHRQATI